MIDNYLVKCYRAIVLDSPAEYDQLLNAQTRVLDPEPNSATALNNRGVAFREIGDTGQAIRDLSDAIGCGADALPLMKRGDILVKLGRSSEALLDYSAGHPRLRHRDSQRAGGSSHARRSRQGTCRDPTRRAVARGRVAT